MKIKNAPTTALMTIPNLRCIDVKDCIPGLMAIGRAGISVDEIKVYWISRATQIPGEKKR